MADQEVQDILQEIRERVRAGEKPQIVNSPGVSDNSPARLEFAPLPPVDQQFAGLTTLDRAWDRLPPVVSNRSGTTARFELWIKSRIKRMLRWITWEQVNFNAAVNHTLHDVVKTLAAHEQQLSQYDQTVNELKRSSQLARNELVAEVQQRREAFAAHQYELNQLQTVMSSLRSDISIQRQEITDIAETQLLELVARCEGLQTQRNEVATELNSLQARLATLENQSLVQRDTVSAQLNAFESDRQETQKKLAALLAELRERDDRLFQEQRVCFKQLSLETNEAYVLRDRVYRELTERIARLETGDRADKQTA
jgi:hypothetical protein